MQSKLVPLLRAACEGGYALGAFNVYNLEGARAVAEAAEAARSPAILQLHPGALASGGRALVALCMAAAAETGVPIVVHLDHAVSPDAIRAALAAGVPSIMADGSHLPYDRNVTFTHEMVGMAAAQGAAVEAELGRLSGTEDGLTVADYEARLTDPDQAADFVGRTGVDALAVCIGNVHGRYRGEPRLDFERLAAIRQAVPIPLVLHGASGLPDGMVRQAISHGVAKINVNTELREASIAAVRARLDDPQPADVVDLMSAAVAAMRRVVAAKLELFGSAGRA
jgi:tagatose 1,6-diphosphate aldolase GatY/KbaY